MPAQPFERLTAMSATVHLDMQADAVRISAQATGDLLVPAVPRSQTQDALSGYPCD